MCFNLFCHCCDDLSNHGQADRQRKGGDAGRESKIPRTEMGIMEHGVTPTASELEAVSTPCKESGAEKGGLRRRVGDSPALNEEGMAYTLERGFDKGALANVNV